MATSKDLAKWAESDALYLTTEEAAALLGSDRNDIAVMASTQEGREALGFRVIRVGSRTKIPRIPFLRFLGYEGAIRGATA